jgi:hypothetical protein
MEIAEKSITEKSEKCFDFWFKFPCSLEKGHNYGYNSKGSFLFTRVLPKIGIPDSGIVMQMGSNFCVSFDILYRKYGERALGIDLWNPLDHPNVDEINVYDLPDINLAFCHVDSGHFQFTPSLRTYSIEYAIRNTLQGGAIITAGGNYVNECLGVNLNEMFLDSGYTIKNCKDYTDETVLDKIGVQHEIIAIKN